jgi:hypothetical protein
MTPLFFTLFCVAFSAPLFHSSSAAKILVFSPTMSRSHMISNARIADSLAKDGHNVVSYRKQ